MPGAKSLPPSEEWGIIKNWEKMKKNNGLLYRYLGETKEIGKRTN